MRFCLSLTAHYSILHLTGSASFTDDPFNKCFSKKFLLPENVGGSLNVFGKSRGKKSGSVVFSVLTHLHSVSLDNRWATFFFQRATLSWLMGSEGHKSM